MPVPPEDLAGMNPERAFRLLEPGELEGDRPPSPIVKPEQVVTGANHAPLGDLAFRMVRRMQQQRKENVPPAQGATSYSRPSVSPIKAPKTSSLPRAMRSSAPPNVSSLSLKRNLERQDTRGEQRSKRRALAPSASPRQHDVEYLRGLINTRTFYLILEPELKKQIAAPVTTYVRHISDAGILQHEAVASRTTIPCLSLPSLDQFLISGQTSVTRIVKGSLLEDVWSQLSAATKYNYVRQLRKILTNMRKPSLHGHRQLGSIRAGTHALLLDKRAHSTYWTAERRPGEQEFANFLLSSLDRYVPTAVRATLASQLQHRSTLVLAHGDIGPRNIIVHNAKIEYIIGWDAAGWYPDWWEYVKFFETPTAPKNKDWYDYANEIFEEVYPTQLSAYQGVLRFQRP